MLYSVSFYIRLLLSPHFGGTAADFDFGNTVDLDECMVGERRKLAFRDLNSFYHALQGFAVLLFFPAFYRLVLLSWNESLPLVRVALLFAGQFAAFSMVVYPVYNLRKRIKACWRYLASSSLGENAMELVGGFSVGISLGLLLTAIQYRAGAMESNATLIHSVLAVDGMLGVSTRSHVATMFTCSRRVVGIIILGATVVGVVGQSLSWNARLETNDDVRPLKGYDVNFGMGPWWLDSPVFVSRGDASFRRKNNRRKQGFCRTRFSACLRPWRRKRRRFLAAVMSPTGHSDVKLPSWLPPR